MDQIKIAGSGYGNTYADTLISDDAWLVAGDKNAGGFASYYFTEETLDLRQLVAVGSGLTIANGVLIENAVGGNGNDSGISACKFTCPSKRG